MTRAIPRPARASAVLVLVAVLGASAACSEVTPPQQGTTGPRPTSLTTAEPTPSATPTPTPAALPGLKGGPVLAVKIDNTSSSRPRIGLNQADVVYVEPVEAGLTRLLAVFSSSPPAEVGPVRSARESDVDLLANYGRVAFAFSGASAGTLDIVGRGGQINLSNDASQQGFRRDGRRPAPYNVIGNVQALLARAGGSTPPGDVGFQFGPAPAGGVPAGTVATAWPRARIELTWDPGRRQYLVAMDGQPDLDAVGGQHGATTVIVQQVQTRLSANRDVNGVQTPVVTVVGQGAATVLRDGLAWTGQWSRPDAAAPTRFTTNGQPMTLAGGPVWVLLVPAGQPVHVG